MRTKIITAVIFLILVALGFLLFEIFSDTRESFRGVDSDLVFTDLV